MINITKVTEERLLWIDNLTNLQPIAEQNTQKRPFRMQICLRDSFPEIFSPRRETSAYFPAQRTSGRGRRFRYRCSFGNRMSFTDKDTSILNPRPIDSVKCSYFLFHIFYWLSMILLYHIEISMQEVTRTLFQQFTLNYLLDTKLQLSEPRIGFVLTIECNCLTT